MKQTKKALIQGLTGAEVTVTMIGGFALEDWPARVAQIKGLHPEATETDKKIEFAPSAGCVRFVMKPMFARIRNGRIRFTSSQYHFEWGQQSSSGGISELYIGQAGCLELQMFDGAVLRYQRADQVATSMTTTA